METLIVDRADGVVTVTLNRPEKKNAINGPMWRELIEVFDEVADTPGDRVLVITGAGDGFCSGADLSPGNNPDLEVQPGGIGSRGVGRPRAPSWETSRGKSSASVQSLTIRARRTQPGSMRR